MIPRRSNDAPLPATNPPSVTLGSGRKISKASLFNVLQAGGWGAAYAVCALAAEQNQGFWPAVLDTLIWAFCGFLVTLGLHHLYRRLRRLHLSHVAFAAVALISSVLFAPLWYFMEHVCLLVTLPAVLQVNALRSLFSVNAAVMLREPLLLTQYL